MLFSADPINVTVTQPFDWIGSVLVPAAAILVSATIAIRVAAAERRAARRALLHAASAELIRKLNDVGWCAQYDHAGLEAAVATYFLELSAFGALLNSKEIVVAKFVASVMDRADPHAQNGMVLARHAAWLATAVELWARGTLKPRDFVKNMPSRTTPWVDSIDLSEWRASSVGDDITGMPSI